MTPMKLRILIAQFTYAGNGGVSTVLPEISTWLSHTMQAAREDDRVERVIWKRYGDIPLTMERNRAVLEAKELECDVILMLDSDNQPDLYVGHRVWAKPFFTSSFDFLYKRSLRGVPTCVCAPYCGPPPHPTTGGMENVYVFYAENAETGDFNTHRFEAYSRQAAAQMRGIQEIAAGPTGCCMYSLDAFDVMPIDRRPKGEILDDYANGKLERDRAIRLLNMESWFFYEFTDQYQTQKASTEDVTNTREIQLSGIERYGEPIVFCNWDAWAGHWKPKCVGMPEPLRMEQINEVYREAVKQDLSIDEEIRCVDFTRGEIPIGYSDAPDPDEEDLDEEPHEGVELEGEGAEEQAENINGFNVVPWLFHDRTVYSVGHRTNIADLDVLTELVRRLAKRYPDRHLRIAEIGTWVGESALALHEGLGKAGGTIWCIDTFEGSTTDRMGEIADAVGPETLMKYLRMNLGDLLDEDIKVIRQDSLTFAEELAQSGGADLDLIFHDADHSHEFVSRNLEAWLPHLSNDGIYCGHDYVHCFPGVIKAVDEMCDIAGRRPHVAEGTTVWWIRKRDLLSGLAAQQMKQNRGLPEEEANAEETGQQPATAVS